MTLASLTFVRADSLRSCHDFGTQVFNDMCHVHVLRYVVVRQINRIVFLALTSRVDGTLDLLFGISIREGELLVLYEGLSLVLSILVPCPGDGAK